MDASGKRIYYDINNGRVLAVVPEISGFFIETTIEQDIASYQNLRNRDRSSFDVIQLGYGQYAQDFAEAIDYRVNPETKTLEFSYPDPNNTEPIEPVYQASLSEEVEGIKARQDATENAILALMMGGE